VGSFKNNDLKVFTCETKSSTSISHVSHNNRINRKFGTDESGFHDDFKSIKKQYMGEQTTAPQNSAKVKQFIKETVESNPVVIFMKGTADAPKCGFSAIAVRLLQEEGVKNLKSVDVLVDNEVREGIKEYTGWKTIPQVFINKEFIGGADIIKEMFQNGELTQKLKSVLQN